MATRIFSGDAVAIAQVDVLRVFGTPEATDVFRMTINGKNLDVVAGSTDPDTIAATIATAWNASTIPEFAEVTAAATTENGRITLTADTPGKPFTVTVDSFEDIYLGAYDDQDFTQTTSTANDGPNVWTKNNFKTAGVRGTLPTNDDTVIFRDSEVDLKYNLDQSAVGTNFVLEIEASYTGEIGLPAANEDGDIEYDEYRPRELHLDTRLLEIGKGDGSGSSKIRLKGVGVTTTATIFSTGSSSDDQKTVEIEVGTSNLVSLLLVLSGSVELSDFDGGSGTSVVAEGDSDLSLIGIFSGGITSVDANGATTVSLPPELAATPTTINLRGGTINNKAADNITNLNIFSGAFNLSPTGAMTIANLIIGPGGIFNTADAVGAVTITNTTLQGGLSGTATINDPNAKTIWSTDIDIGPAKQADFVLDFGPGRDVGISGP